MSEPKHTSLPWTVDYSDPGSIFIREKIDEPICKLLMSMDLPVDIKQIIQANAEFIVQACNNYYALRSACQIALSYIEHHTGNTNAGQPPVKGMKEATMKRLENVIAKTKR